MREPLVRQWLPRCARVAKRFGSVCGGTFVLAALGLLDGKRAATHWSATEPLAKYFPRVTVDPEALYVVDGRDLLAWLPANLQRRLDVPTLAAQAGFSERNFYRKFVATMGETPAHYIEIVRLSEVAEAARCSLFCRSA